jgi:hypothetical protein
MLSSNKDKTIGKAVTRMVFSQGDDTLHSSKLPQALKFPLLVILSLSLSSLLYSFTAQHTAGELTAVSRSLNEWWEVGVLVSWKMYVVKYDQYKLELMKNIELSLL